MVLATIINKESQIYIKQQGKGDIKRISFDKVDKGGITHLNKEQVSGLLGKLFNTEKRYLESRDGYNVYLDGNYFKRYYKNGVEDFDMFFLNNGKDAAAYFEKGIKTTARAFLFTLGALVTTVTITSEGIGTLQDFVDGKVDSNVLTVNTDIDSYTPVTLETLKSYIFSSEGLSDYDKESLYNEDYLSFVLSISSDERKIYDFNERFKEISIHDDADNEYSESGGYYIYGTNTINILGKNSNAEQRKHSVTHEFVHLTQAGNEYSYLNEALAEIMLYEFYGIEPVAYRENIKMTKVLMEIIGPDPVLNAVYSYDDTMFKDSVRQYLDSENAETLLDLLKSTSLGDDNQLSSLLGLMIKNKYNQDDSKEYKGDSIIMRDILEGSSQQLHNRIYFNSQSAGFYEVYNTHSEIEYKIPSGDFKSVESMGQPYGVTLAGVGYPKTEFEEIIKKNGFDEFISNFLGYYMCYRNSNGQQEYIYVRLESGDTGASILKHVKDNVPNYTGVTFEIYSPNIDDEKSCIYLTWDNFKNNPYIVSFDYCMGDITFDDNNKINKILFGWGYDMHVYENNFVIPSIYEKFGNSGLSFSEYEKGRKK